MIAMGFYTRSWPSSQEDTTSNLTKKSSCGDRPAEQLLEEAYSIARRIAQHSPVAIALTRQMMYRCAAQPHPIEAHKVDSLAIYYTSLNSGKEGVQSFLEKRTPEFTQRTSTDMPPFYPWWE